MNESLILEYIRALYPVFVSIAALVSLCFTLWLASKFQSKVDAKADGEVVDETIKTIEKKIAGHSERIVVLEEHATTSPTRAELHGEIGNLAERMSGVEAGIRGLGVQQSTTNDYMKILVENAVKP